MKKPELLRAIYSELRTTVGSEVSAGDLLRLAHHILRAYTDETAGLAEHAESRPEQSLFGMPVDRAMRDAGWRLYKQEVPPEGRDGYNSGESNLLRAKIEKYLGPEWRHLIPTDQL